MDATIKGYLDAYAAANGPTTKPPHIVQLGESGWYELDRRRVGRKSLLTWTERLKNRAAGIAMMTDEEIQRHGTTRSIGIRNALIKEAHVLGGESGAGQALAAFANMANPAELLRFAELVKGL